METYDYAINQMSRLLKERHVCLYSRKAHERCYVALRNYLATNGLQFSLEYARRWLKDVVKPQESQQEFWVQWCYIDQLDELVRTGTVLQDHLLLTKSNYEKLTLMWRSELDDYLISRKNEYTTRSLALVKLRCSKFLLRLQEWGILSVDKISCQSICWFYEQDIPVAEKERYVLLSNARQFLQYLVSNGRCEPVFPLLLEENIYKYSTDKLLFCEDVISKSFTYMPNEFACSAKQVLDSVEPFKQNFEKHGYMNTMKYSACHIIKCLYAFLACHHLDYSPSIAKRWYYQIEPIIGSSYHTWIRVLCLFEKYMQGDELILSQKYSFKPSRMESYPLWCSEAVEGYLYWLKRYFRSESTIRTYKYSVYDFCDYLLGHKIESFEEIERTLILDYLKQDRHATVRGISMRRTVLRQFVMYLEDYNWIKDKTLYHVFPNKVASVIKIPSILSAHQISAIDKFRQECTSALDLRDSAMVMVGLTLGLRTSDTINLKLGDIDWIHKEVHIIQCKTKVPITLPLRTDVGNAIFRYLKYGRPASDSEYVFIRHRAPYGKLSGKLCSNALNSISQRCGFDSAGSFHILRRTFATNILKNHAGIERVIDALGHQDSTTVNRYLAFDEMNMKKCPLSLADLDIQIGGDY